MKERIVSVIVGLLIICFFIPASANDRYRWMYSSDTYNIYLDTATVSYSKPEIINVIIKREFSEDAKKNLNSVYGDGCSYILIYYKMDIKNRKMEHIQSVCYNDADEEVKRVSGHGGFRLVQGGSGNLQIHEGAEEWTFIFDYVQTYMKGKTFQPIAYDDMFIGGITVMENSLDDVKSKMGNPQAIEPLMMEGSYDSGVLVCKYPGTTYFIDARHANEVLYISTNNPLLSTKRGICVGDDITKVISAYGSPTSKNQNRYYYNRPSAKYRNNLIFVLDDQSAKVMRIIISVMP